MNVAAGDLNERQTDVPVQLSIVVAVDAAPDLPSTLSMYRQAIEGLGFTYELFCVVDGQHEEMLSALANLADDWSEMTVLGQKPWLDDEAALHAAVKRSRGNIVLTLAGWPEVAPDDLQRMVDVLGEADMAVANRGNLSNSWRNRMLQRTIKSLFGQSISDIFCRTRAARRTVMEEASGFGVRQHFLPVTTAEMGYSVREVDVASAPVPESGTVPFVFKPLGHLRALFDILTLFVVLKFLRRPLRFFGAVGLPVFLLGSLVTAIYLGMRIFGGVPLADRPGLIFSVLLVVLGLQVIALGLVGEIIVFANSRRLKQYTIKAVIKSDSKKT